MGLEDEIQRAKAERLQAEKVKNAWASVGGDPSHPVLSEPHGTWRDLVREVLPLIDWSAHEAGREYRGPDGTTRFGYGSPGKRPRNSPVNYLEWKDGKGDTRSFRFVLTSSGLVSHSNLNVDEVKAWIVPVVADAAVRKSAEDRAKAKSSGLTGCSVAVLLILTSAVGAFAGLLDLAS